MRRNYGNRRENIQHTVERLHALSDGINEVIYVSDPETCEILFANKKTKEQFGKKIEGKKCHKVFRNLDTPCPACTNEQIFGKNLGKTYIWDHQNQWNERWYRGICKAIKWPNGKYVRYGMAIDTTEQKTTENALKQSEDKLRLFAENAKDLIYRYVPEKGFDYVNPAATRITGYRPVEHYNDPSLGYKIVYPEDRPKFEKLIQDFHRHRNPKTPVEIRWVHKNGHIITMEQVNVPVYDERGNLAAIEGVARDVTERTEMNKALKESESRYRSLFEDSPIALWEFDFSDVKKRVESLRESGVDDFREYFGNHPEAVVDLANAVRVVSVNRATLKLYKARNLHELKRRLVEVFGGEDYEAFKEALIALAEGKNSCETEITTRTLKGKRMSVALKVSIIPGCEKTFSKAFASMIDITEESKMAEALRNSEEFFRSVVENSHNGILLIDENFRITYANAQALHMGGYSRSDVVGQDFRKLLHKDSMSLVQDRYLNRLGGKNPPSQYVLKAVRKDGEKRDFELKASRILDNHGRVCIVAQLLDVTEHRRMEDERKHFAERLSTLNKYGQSLNMAKSLKEVHAVTLEAMEKTLGFEYASILKVEGKTLRLMCNRGYSKGFSLRLPLDGEKGVTVRAAKTGKPVCIKDLRKEGKYIIGKPGMLSELAVPIKEGKKVLGVLNVESERPVAFSEEDAKLLEILASHTATALTNLNKQKRLSALNEYGKSLNMAENLNAIYKQTLNAMERTLGFEFATFFVVEEKKLRLAAHRGYPKRLSVTLSLDGDRGVSLRAARTGRPIFIRDIRREKAYISGRPGMLSELAVPIKIGHKVLGVLNVESERLAAFDENDREMLEILASHAATAMGNLNRRDQFRNLSSRLEYLMKNTTKIIQAKNMHQRLKVITKAICRFGWRRVVISLRDENLEGTDTVTAGLTKEENRLLMKRKAPGHIWQERLGPKFERHKIGEFYYLPWNDPWVRENVHGVPPETPTEEVTTYAGVPSKLSPEKMVDWHPQDMLYAPLRTPERRIVGILSMDDPTDGRKPTRESLVPLELFLHQAAMIIENARLIESLREAREQLETYADHLEQKVEERTRELRISQEQLLKAQRLAVIGELAGMVGHDLRNPLTSIAGATYYVKKRLVPKMDGKIKEMLELIEKNIFYSNKIINDLLDYSRELKLDVTETAPASIMKEVLSLVEIPDSIQLVNLTKGSPKMKIDVEKTERCFINIINNAIDAMPNGGKLTIECAKVGDKVRFLFSDTGAGMSTETIVQLWTPLFTTKAKGMGFGLPICKRIVEAHGGLISATSVLGKGTTFEVSLPIRPKPREGGEELWVKTPESSLLMTMRT